MPELEILAATHGIAPRSDELLRLGGDLERGRVSQASFDERVGQETADWIELQRAAGIDLIEDGKLRWQDHLRPIVKATKGFAEGVDEATLVRWPDSNRFFHQPTITGELEFQPAVFESIVGPPADEYVSVLAPYSFIQFAQNHFDLDLRLNVGQLYQQLVSYYEAKGVSRILFEEAAIPADIIAQIKHSPEASEQINLLANVYPQINFGYTNLATGNSINFNAPRNVGYEVSTVTLRNFRRRWYAIRPHLRGRELWNSAINARTTLTDELETGWPNTFLCVERPARIILTNTVDFEYLPLPYAQAKVRRLGEFVVLLSEHLEAAADD